MGNFKIPSLNLSAFHIIADKLKKEIYILSDFNWKRLILLLCRNACTDNEAGRESGWRLLYWDTRVQLEHELPFWQMHLYMQMRECLLEIVLNTNGSSFKFSKCTIRKTDRNHVHHLKQIYKNWEENLDTFVIGYNKLHLLWYFARTLAQVHFIS